jgi:hypothetical protein
LVLEAVRPARILTKYPPYVLGKGYVALQASSWTVHLSEIEAWIIQARGDLPQACFAIRQLDPPTPTGSCDGLTMIRD